MGFREGVGVQRKLEGFMECVFERNIRDGSVYFSNLVSLKVGNGSLICFWHDVWCGEVTLMSSLPYLIARD
jgi:hypothetical protein